MTSAGEYSRTFTATSTSTLVGITGVPGNGLIVDSFSVRIAEADRSVNGNGLQVFGTVTKTAVATGADLVAYSGFSSSNYLEQTNASDLPTDATDTFCIQAWVRKDGDLGTSSTSTCLLSFGNNTTSGQERALTLNRTEISFGVSGSSIQFTETLSDSVWSLLTLVHDGSGNIELFINGKTKGIQSANLVSSSTSSLRVGYRLNDIQPATNASLALIRISATAPLDEQIAKIYEDEKFLFQENAKATVYGGNAVTSLAYDDDKELLHVGTSAGRSVFQGLRRIDNTTDAVGAAISASNGMVAED